MLRYHFQLEHCPNVWWLAGDMELVFGTNILQYVLQLTQGQIDYLPRLPKHIIIHIVQFLELSDIATLAQVSKHFRRVTVTLDVRCGPSACLVCSCCSNIV